MKVLVDASTLIALANIGELGLLKDYTDQIFITEKVKEEVISGKVIEHPSLENSVGNWIDVVQAPENDNYSGLKGLDLGERSILNYANNEDDIFLLLDEKEARAVAKSEGFDFTGTLGLIVHLCERGELSKEKGREIVKKLANSEFRMTVSLYDWALEKLD